MADLERCLTVDEAADWLGVDHKTVRRGIDRGDIPAFRVGRALRIPADELREALRERPRTAEIEVGARPRSRPRPVTGHFSQRAREESER